MPSSVITCECGAKVRLPEGAGARVFRCPKCKTSLALTVNAQVLSSTRLGAGEEATCPICQSGIDREEVVVTCPECDQIHHRECWSEIGGCGTYGCAQAPAPPTDNKQEQLPLSAWGDEKACPACGEKIKSIAVKCRYCGTTFDTVDPLTMADLRKRVRSEESSSALQKVVVALFALSILGCLAPLILPIGLAILIPKRRDLARAGPTYMVMGYTSVILSAIISILMLAFWLIGS